MNMNVSIPSSQLKSEAKKNLINKHLSGTLKTGTGVKDQFVNI